MKIQFSTGAAGFHEAHELKKSVHYHALKEHGGHRSEILERFEQAADEQMERPEFASLLEETVIEDQVEAERVSPLRVWWDSLMGPGGREQELALQRMDALNRAQRAEAATFDAMSEAAQLRIEVEQLRARIRELEQGSDEPERPQVGT